jgi:hypothetical protein
MAFFFEPAAPESLSQLSEAFDRSVVPFHDDLPTGRLRETRLFIATNHGHERVGWLLYRPANGVTLLSFALRRREYAEGLAQGFIRAALVHGRVLGVRGSVAVAVSRCNQHAPGVLVGVGFLPLPANAAAPPGLDVYSLDIGPD